MSSSSGTTPSTWPRSKLGLSIALIAIASYAIGTSVSFHPAIAPIKLAVGILHFVAIGFSCSILLKLERPRVLAAGQDALLGQLLCLAYVYVRSALCDWAELPGISTLEIFSVEAVLIACAVTQCGEQVARTESKLRHAISGIGVHVLWLGWLFAIATQKLDLYFTPSSDPDIHAFYARVFAEHGHIYYDLLPGSDASMVYPSAFASLNFVLGRLSGLHPVQLVNISAYLQLTLFAGVTFSVLASAIRGRAAQIATAVVHFGFVYIAFNAVFGEHRMFLEGTPRLAHSALLIFPLLFAAQQRDALSQNAWLWSIPFASVAIGVCINPAHLPAALLLGTFALMSFGTGAVRAAHSPKHWVAIAGCAAVVFGIIVSQDPFYRSLVAQQTHPEGWVEPATDLTGGALRSEISFSALFTNSAPAALRSLALGSNDSMIQSSGRGCLLALLAGAVAFNFAIRKRPRSNHAAVEPLLLLTAASFAAVLVHGIWSEFTSEILEAGVLQTRLLVQYTGAFQRQINLLFFGITPTLIVCMFSQWANGEHEGEKFRSPALTLSVVAGMIALAMPLLHGQFKRDRQDFYDVMRTSPLGEVAALDVEFAKQLEQRVPENQRVLVPGRTRRVPGEHWIFTTDSARAVPLFSKVRTSFFLGLDGAAFTADAYVAHVAPPNFDPDWLRAMNTTWLVESGNFSRRVLNAHYERVVGTDRVVLWRLRD